MDAIMNLWNRLTGGPRESSASVAKHRLQLVLVQDRVKLPPEVMEAIKEEIIAVISKYVDIDKEGLEVTLTRGESLDKLTANIPVRRARM
jgi:cell division topological specificity factor